MVAEQAVGTPGRYWGPGTGKDAAGSPSQASLLLARINARARERKAAQSPGATHHYGNHEAHGAGDGMSATKTRVPKTWGATHTDTVALKTKNRTPRNDGKEPRLVRDSPNTEGKLPRTQDTTPDTKGMLASPEMTNRAAEVAHTTPKARNTIPRTDTVTPKIGDVAPKANAMADQTLHENASNDMPLDVRLLEPTPDGTSHKKKKKKKKREEAVERRNEMEDNIHVPSGMMETEEASHSMQQEEEEDFDHRAKKKKKRRRTAEEVKVSEVVDMAKTGSLNGPQEEEEEFDQKKKGKKRKRKEKEEESKNENLEGVSVEALNGLQREEDSCDHYEKKKKKKKFNLDTEEQNEEDFTVDVAARKRLSIEKPTDKQDDHPAPQVPKKVKKEIKVEVEEYANRSAEARGAEGGEWGDYDGTGENKEQSAVREESWVKKKAKNRKKKKDLRKKKMEKRMMEAASKKKDREVAGFTVIRDVELSRKEKLQRTLPHWLANPTVIGRDLYADGAPVASLPSVQPSLCKLLQENGIHHFFPVQKAVIPEILGGAGPLATRYRPRDICVSAPTGSGKTLAFVLPLVQALQGRTVPRIRALILLPVQELAMQVSMVFKRYLRGSDLKVGVAVGQKSFQTEQASLVGQDYRGHHSLVDILVATPGKLADHLRLTQGLDLSALQYLVLDEADRMLAAEGGEWVSRIQQAIITHQEASQPSSLPREDSRGGDVSITTTTALYPRPPLQRLLFSATLSHDPEQLQHISLHRPKLFTVATPSGPEGTAAVVVGQFVRPAELREEYLVVEEQVKPLALHHLLATQGKRKVLIFTNSVQATHKLALLLEAMAKDSFKVAEFSSREKANRQQIVSQFAAGKIDVLVSSDAMARGVDVPDIEHVVSYDVTSAVNYVHRIGRTARAGKAGGALSLVTKDTIKEFRRTVGSSGNKGLQELTLTTEELEPYEELYVAALATLKDTLEQEKQGQRQNPKATTARKKKQTKNKGARKIAKKVKHSKKPKKNGWR